MGTRSPHLVSSTSIAPPSRRTFVKGLAAGGAVAGLGLWRPSAWASTDVGRQPRELSGSDFDLTIGETLMNFTGSPRVTVTVNDSVPAPTLRGARATRSRSGSRTHSVRTHRFTGMGSCCPPTWTACPV